MPFIRYTTKKILINVALLYTLVPMVKIYVETGVISELVIKCVRWAIARQGAFYIYGNFFEKFLRNGFQTQCDLFQLFHRNGPGQQIVAVVFGPKNSMIQIF